MNNILMLTGAMFMLYDRVMPSRSVPSLVALSRGFVGARQSWQRLSRLLAHLPMLAAPIALQAPLKLLAVQMSR
jgi:ABC-type protease/lipase transport system fused ATPase/permease subunit